MPGPAPARRCATGLVAGSRVDRWRWRSRMIPGAGGDCAGLPGLHRGVGDDGAAGRGPPSRSSVVLAAQPLLLPEFVPGWEDTSTGWPFCSCWPRSRCRRHPDDRPATGGCWRPSRRSPRWRCRTSAPAIAARPARHPRPLADRDHGQGRAGPAAARRRPGRAPAPRSTTWSGWPGDALADVRATAIGRTASISLAGRARRARAALAGGRHRGRRCRGAADDVPDAAAGAVRLGRPRGRHQRGAAQPARPACEIRLRPTSVEIVDDGRRSRRPARAPAGQGLRGLRERAEALRRPAHRRPGAATNRVRAAGTRAEVPA